MTFGCASAGSTQHDLRVRLGVDQAGEAVARVAADAAARPRGFCSSSMTPSGTWNGRCPSAREIVVQLLDARLVADRGIRIGRAGRRLGRVDAALAVHLIEALGLGVVRLELVVADRPRRRDAAVMPQLAEVLSPQPEQRRAVELRVAADVVVGVRMQRLARPASRHTSFVWYFASTLTARELQLSFSRGT